MTDDGELRKALGTAAGHLSSARWSGSKGAECICVHELFRFIDEPSRCVFGAVISFPPSTDRHFAPFILSGNGKAGLRPFEVSPGRYLAEAERTRGFSGFAIGMMRRGGRTPGDGAEIVWSGPVPPGAPGAVHPMGGDTTNVVVGLRLGRRRAVLKSYRTIDPDNPEPELLGHLSRQRCEVTPRVWGSYSMMPTGGAGEGAVLGVLLKHVDGQPAFQAFVGNARRSIQKDLPPHYCLPTRLGAAVAELHCCLFDPKAPPPIMPEHISPGDIVRWQEAIMARHRQALGILPAKDRARLVNATRPLQELLAGMDGWKDGWKMRTHQDLHLGQIMVCRQSFKIIDFEGEPMRKGAARMEKLPPERDLGTMLRSFAYAARIGMAGGNDAVMAERARKWEDQNLSSFLKGYVGAGPPTISDREGIAARVRLWAAEKALYEIVYEARFRPELVTIPVEGFLKAVEGNITGV